MKDVTREVRDVFQEAIEDALNGIPNSRHPVQFTHEKHLAWPLSKCLHCKSLVEETDEDGHREYHDKVNAELSRIMEQARRHVPEPTYVGR